MYYYGKEPELINVPVHSLIFPSCKEVFCKICLFYLLRILCLKPYRALLDFSLSCPFFSFYNVLYKKYGTHFESRISHSCQIFIVLSYIEQVLSLNNNRSVSYQFFKILNIILHFRYFCSWMKVFPIETNISYLGSNAFLFIIRSLQFQSEF